MNSECVLNPFRKNEVRDGRCNINLEKKAWVIWLNLKSKP